MKPDWGVNPKAVLAECMAATLFVFIGVAASRLLGPRAAAEVVVGQRQQQTILMD